MGQMMRLKVNRHLLHQLRQPYHGSDQVQLVGVVQERHIARSPVQVFLAGQIQDAGDSGMSVLNVVDRVFRRLLLGQLQVKIHLG